MSGKSNSDQNLTDVVINIEEDDDANKVFKKVPDIEEKSYGKETSVYQTTTELNTGERIYGADFQRGQRNVFILRVLMVDFLLLIITSVFLLMVYTIPSIKSEFLRNWLAIAITGLVVTLAVHCTITMQCARNFLVSIILLILLLIGTSLITAAVTARYNSSALLVALAATAAVVFVCMMLACTSFDFTKFWLLVIGVSVAFSVVVIGYIAYVLISGQPVSTISMIIAFVATLLSAVSLIMELQAVIGGKKVELSENEYALGAAMIYSSIMNMFMNIAMLANETSD